MTTAVTQIKKLLGLKSFDGYLGLIEPIKQLIKERDEALKLRESYNSNVEDWRELCGYFNLPVSTLSDVLSAINTMRLERDMLRSERKVLSDLNEIRYVLHGDIQPCTVLYSDDTTTLLRLDEGDVMCETDTIEWSDSVTYRCQELLRGFVGLTASATLTASAMKGMSHAMAQLVRDERILLNEDALGVVSGERHAPTGDEPCVECNLPFDKNAVTCPVCNTIRPTEPAPKEC